MRTSRSRLSSEKEALFRQVQDAFATPVAHPTSRSSISEVVAPHAINYNLNLPEAATMLLMGGADADRNVQVAELPQ